MNDDFSDAALILVGHGSTKNAGSGAVVYQHAAELRRRRIFAAVVEGFWKIEPGIADVLRGVIQRRIFIVPLFISEGYFTEEAIPIELGFRTNDQANWARVQQRDGQVLYYCSPVGTHPSMTEVLLARARDVVARHPFPHTPKPSEMALFIAGHGTEQNENSRKAIDGQVERIRGRNEYAEAHSVFIEEDPRIGDCYRIAQARNIVMVPFFISEGLHSVEDIPILLGDPERLVRDRLSNGQPTWRNPTERNGKRVWYSASVGTDPHVVEVILTRVREALEK